MAVLEVHILVCSSALPRGTLSTCLSDTPILGSGHVLLYPLDTVPTLGACPPLHEKSLPVPPLGSLSPYPLPHITPLSPSWTCSMWSHGAPAAGIAFQGGRLAASSPPPCLPSFLCLFRRRHCIYSPTPSPLVEHLLTAGGWGLATRWAYPRGCVY